MCAWAVSGWVAAGWAWFASGAQYGYFATERGVFSVAEVDHLRKIHRAGSGGWMWVAYNGGMTNDQITKTRDRVAGVVGATLALLSGFGVVAWDTTQTALVVAASASCVMFIGSLFAHLQKETSAEWPAVAMSFVAFVASGLAALNSVGVLNLSAQQIELVIGVITAVLGLGGIPIVNRSIANAQAARAAGPGGSNDPVNGQV